MYDASIVISVYDKVRELELIFHALSIQDYDMTGIEVIVAEDGMNEPVRALTTRWSEESPLKIKHLTQEDKGFRKNRILNAAVRESSAGYLIFIDGDCIPHNEFISAHLKSKKPGRVMCGRRVNLTKKLSDGMSPESVRDLSYSRTLLTQLIFSSLNKHKATFSYNAEEGLIVKSPRLRKLMMNKDEHILGCNFSIHKHMLEDINGFDENYEGPGLGEDSDIEHRLRLRGAKFGSVRNLAVVYHIYHPKTKENPSNMEYFLGMKASGKYYCHNGLSK